MNVHCRKTKKNVVVKSPCARSLQNERSTSNNVITKLINLNLVLFLPQTYTKKKYHRKNLKVFSDQRRYDVQNMKKSRQTIKKYLF